ncbi:MAG: helix-turn-helix domain-containing protein [Chitinophagaceae bacterium]
MNSYATASLKETETAHPQLHRQLRELRNKICEQKNLPLYLVASSKTIDEMVQYLPQTPEELIKISGFGRAKVDQYGDKFLGIIANYCKQYHLSSLIHEKFPKRERKIKDDAKPDTKTLSYQLYKGGKAVTEIAELRNLAVSTIEGHLAVYVQKGIISVNELVNKEKILLIEPLLENSEAISFSSIKENLDGVVSYSEIKLVVAAKEWERRKNESTQQHPVPIA